MNPDIDKTYATYRRNHWGGIERIPEGTQDYMIAMLREENTRLRHANTQLQDELDELKGALKPFASLAKIIVEL